MFFLTFSKMSVSEGEDQLILGLGLGVQLVLQVDGCLVGNVCLRSIS
jgi:hypothetical protein